MSELVGAGFFVRRAAAAISCPDWQYPHSGTSSAIQARCKGWLRSGDRPSIVVTARLLTVEMEVWHERVGTPSRCTVQAPQRPTPQPNLVPVSPSRSRSTQRRDILESSTVTVYGFPLTEMLMSA